MRCILALLVALTPVHAFMSGPAPRRTSATRRPNDREISPSRCSYGNATKPTPSLDARRNRRRRAVGAVRSSPDDFDIDKLAASLENPDEAKKELPDMKDQTAVDKMLDDAISEDDPFGGVPRASLDDLFPQ